MNRLLYEEAIKIASETDVSTSKNTVVLYSISYLPTTENRDKAFAYLKQNPKAVTIEDTVCGRKLVELGIGYQEVGLSQENIAHIWSVASRRFIKSVKGNVTAFVDGADKRSVFCSVELPLLLENPSVTQINNIDKYEFAKKFCISE